MPWTEQDAIAHKDWFEAKEQQFPGLKEKIGEAGGRMGLTAVQSAEMFYYGLQGAQPEQAPAQDATTGQAAAPTASPLTEAAPAEAPTQTPTATQEAPVEGGGFDPGKYQGLMDKLNGGGSTWDQRLASSIGSSIGGGLAGVGATLSAGATGENAALAASENMAPFLSGSTEEDKAKNLELLFKMYSSELEGRKEGRAARKEERDVEAFNVDLTAKKDKADPNSPISVAMREQMKGLGLDFGPDATYDMMAKTVGPAMTAKALQNTIQYQTATIDQGNTRIEQTDAAQNQRAQQARDKASAARRKELEAIIDNNPATSPEAKAAKAELQGISSGAGDSGGGIEPIYIDPNTGQEMPYAHTLETPTTTYEFDGKKDFETAKGLVEPTPAGGAQATTSAVPETPAPVATPLPADPSLSPAAQREVAETQAKKLAEKRAEEVSTLPAKGYEATILKQLSDLMAKSDDISGPVMGIAKTVAPTLTSAIFKDRAEAEGLIFQLIEARAKTFGAAPSEGERKAIKDALLNDFADEKTNMNNVVGQIDKYLTEYTRITGEKSPLTEQVRPATGEGPTGDLPPLPPKTGVTKSGLKYEVLP